MRNEEKRRELRVNPVAAGLAGAVAGAAAAVALSDTRTRSKIVGKLGELKDRAVNKLEEMELGEMDGPSLKAKAIRGEGLKRLTKTTRVTKRRKRLS